MNSYEILTGVGSLWAAAVGTSFPAVTAAPSGSWTNLGETFDGIKINYEEEIELHTTDQRTGQVKPVRIEEGVIVEAKLAQGTLENLAKLLGKTVTGTSPKELTLYKGATVSEYALLVRGPSPYGAAFAAQLQLPRGYFEGPIEQEHTKDGKVLYIAKFMVLEDLTAGAEADRHGKLVAQTA